MKNWLWELLWPPAKTFRLIRELDAREREGRVRFMIESWEFQKRNALREYHRPMFGARFIEERNDE